jgi:hypothetical protein
MGGLLYGWIRVSRDSAVNLFSALKPLAGWQEFLFFEAPPPLVAISAAPDNDSESG